MLASFGLEAALGLSRLRRTGYIQRARQARLQAGSGTFGDKRAAPITQRQFPHELPVALAARAENVHAGP
jgi:hypothetical protein